MAHYIYYDQNGVVFLPGECDADAIIAGQRIYDFWQEVEYSGTAYGHATPQIFELSEKRRKVEWEPILRDRGYFPKFPNGISKLGVTHPR